MRGIELEPLQHTSAFRRIASVAWDTMSDASVYGHLKLDVEPLEAWIAQERERTGQRITLTHCVARAIAVVLRRYPDANVVIRRRRLYRRKDVDVFLQVALHKSDQGSLGKADLSGVVIRRADTLTVAEFEAQLRKAANVVRTGNDPEFRRTKRMTDWMPPWLLRWTLKTISVLQYDFNLDLSRFGIPRDPFGSVAVSSVGMLKVPFGYTPFFPLARLPMQLTIPSILDEPIVKDGQVVAGRVVHITTTFDHRVLDGVQAARMCQDLTDLLMNPEKLDNPP